ncbi:MAG: hypothetical protein Q9218_000781 [Villophora microphyllina]
MNFDVIVPVTVITPPLPYDELLQVGYHGQDCSKTRLIKATLAEIEFGYVG